MLPVGYLPCTQDPPAGQEHGPMIDEMVAEAQAAEASGWDGCYITEHHQQEDGYLPNPLLMAGLIGMKTQRIKVGTCVLLLPLYHPVARGRGLCRRRSGNQRPPRTLSIGWAISSTTSMLSRFRSNRARVALKRRWKFYVEAGNANDSPTTVIIFSLKTRWLRHRLFSRRGRRSGWRRGHRPDFAAPLASRTDGSPIQCSRCLSSRALPIAIAMNARSTAANLTSA